MVELVELYHDGSPSQSGRRHDAIDVETAGERSRSSSAAACVVCLEGVEWAAYGQCAHPDVVCADCAVRIRSAGSSGLCCCICRTHCPTVLVTRVRTAGAPWERPPPPEGEGRVGECWYYARPAAYFDDEEQYGRARTLVPLEPSAHLYLPSASSAGYRIQLFAFCLGLLSGVLFISGIILISITGFLVYKQMLKSGFLRKS